MGVDDLNDFNEELGYTEPSGPVKDDEFGAAMSGDEMCLEDDDTAQGDDSGDDYIIVVLSVFMVVGCCCAAAWIVGIPFARHSNRTVRTLARINIAFFILAVACCFVLAMLYVILLGVMAFLSYPN